MFPRARGVASQGGEFNPIYMIARLRRAGQQAAEIRSAWPACAGLMAKPLSGEINRDADHVRTSGKGSPCWSPSQSTHRCAAKVLADTALKLLTLDISRDDS